jgi:tartrate dehydratase alpha subunit/fumarate hydratase class I-like protein
VSPNNTDGRREDIHLSAAGAGGAMKVKTFTGTHRTAVDKQVNDWLAESNVTVRKTNSPSSLLERGVGTR